ncbi:hypothetical protein C0580_02830 [Candidatus Parcubacteria bacterium]|nr:MAG: hypothetical protein C0580_02830 [Candidatus Parcubacteria bacterium]
MITGVKLSSFATRHATYIFEKGTCDVTSEVSFTSQNSAYKVIKPFLVLKNLAQARFYSSI